VGRNSRSNGPADRLVTYGCGCVVALILLFWALAICGAFSR
jgi:hypothetical protein